MALASTDPDPVSQPGLVNISFDDAVVGQSMQSLNAEQQSGMSMAPAEAAASSAEPEVSFQCFSGFQNKSTSANTRLLNFKIEYRDRTIELNVFDNEKVGKDQSWGTTL